MKGFISVEIPTKRYIKAYLHAQLGDHPLMTTENPFGAKLYDVLCHKKNEDQKRYSKKRYNCLMKVYVPYHTYYHRGGFLNETNIKNFNLSIELQIKKDFRFLMDFYLQFLPSFEANLPQVRKEIGIDIEEWQDDSMRKDYYRYRLRTGKALLYKNDQKRITPSRWTALAAC